MINLFPLSLLFLYFVFSSPLHPCSPVGALWPPQHPLLPWHAAHAHCKRDSPAPLWHSTRNKSAPSSWATAGAPPNWQQGRDLHRRAEQNVLAGATATPNPMHWALRGSLRCPSLGTLRCVWLLRACPGVSCSPLHSQELLAAAMASCPGHPPWEGRELPRRAGTGWPLAQFGCRAARGSCPVTGRT